MREKLSVFDGEIVEIHFWAFAEEEKKEMTETLRELAPILNVEIDAAETIKRLGRSEDWNGYSFIVIALMRYRIPK